MQITLHLPTAAITVAIGSLALFGMSASAPQGTASDRDIQAIVDVSQPSAEDLVWIYGGFNAAATYTVPQGKHLVLTGANSQTGTFQITIDGGPAMLITVRDSGSVSFFSGIPVFAGQTIAILDNGTAGVRSLIGFLEDA